MGVIAENTNLLQRSFTLVYSAASVPAVQNLVKLIVLAFGARLAEDLVKVCVVSVRSCSQAL